MPQIRKKIEWRDVQMLWECVSCGWHLDWGEALLNHLNNRPRGLPSWAVLLSSVHIYCANSPVGLMWLSLSSVCWMFWNEEKVHGDVSDWVQVGLPGIQDPAVPLSCLPQPHGSPHLAGHHPPVLLFPMRSTLFSPPWFYLFFRIPCSSVQNNLYFLPPTLQ